MNNRQRRHTRGRAPELTRNRQECFGIHRGSCAPREHGVVALGPQDDRDLLCARMPHGINVFTAFEDFRKEDDSTWTLTGARAMYWTVEDGTLAIAGALNGTVATAASTVVSPTIEVTSSGIVSNVQCAL